MTTAIVPVPLTDDDLRALLERVGPRTPRTMLGKVAREYLALSASLTSAMSATAALFAADRDADARLAQAALRPDVARWCALRLELARQRVEAGRGTEEDLVLVGTGA